MDRTVAGRGPVLPGVARGRPGEGSTFFGGSAFEHCRDVFADAQGNVFIVGGTSSRDFPTTPGAYDRTYDSSGTQVGNFGHMDAFVAKFSPDGALLWSTYLGGPNYDRAYAVEVDALGYVYVAGRAGPGFPVTAGAFQPTFRGFNAPSSYGWQNGFVAKLKPDGSGLVWASYAGVGSLSRDLAIDQSGNVYLTPGYPHEPTQGSVDPQWYAGGYQDQPQGGRDACVYKISADGTQVLWATYLGGSGDEAIESSVRVDANGYVYVGGSTHSTDFPTTPGAADGTHGGKVDFFVAKLSPDGTKLVYGTYLGGSGNEWISTHNLAVDAQGNAYAAFPTSSSDFVTTPGAFQSTRSGRTDWGVVKLSPTGALLASTLLGGNGDENADGIYVDADGNVFISGETSSSDFPLTPTALQSKSAGRRDAVVVRLSADFSQLLYSTYVGGSDEDTGRTGFLAADGAMLVAGSTFGPAWPTHNAHQDTFGGGKRDVILFRLVPAAGRRGGGTDAGADAGADARTDARIDAGIPATVLFADR